jgi:hypothetical protein
MMIHVYHPSNRNPRIVGLWGKKQNLSPKQPEQKAKRSIGVAQVAEHLFSK